jgi:hypothetical protein
MLIFPWFNNMAMPTPMKKTALTMSSQLPHLFTSDLLLTFTALFVFAEQRALGLSNSSRYRPADAITSSQLIGNFPFVSPCSVP